MYLVDFIYDNKSLSEDFNCIIGTVSSSISEETQLGTERKLNTVQIADKEAIATATYEDSYSTSFDIIANTCRTNIMNFTDEEVYRIQMWLNQKQYKPFIPLYNDDSFFSIFFYATFTSVIAIKIGTNIIGFHVEMKTNSPYAYSKQSLKKVCTNDKYKFNVFNTSQEFGYLNIRSFKVTCNESGNFIIVNNTDDKDREIRINNVVAGEVLTIDGEHETVVSSGYHEKLYNDFSYNFPRLFRGDSAETLNEFELKGIKNVKIELEYDEVRKTGIII